MLPDMSEFVPAAVRMIDVGDKPISVRTARATGRLAARPETVARIRDGRLAKGDALGAARLAGIMAAKRTSELVPLCHPLPLDSIDVVIDATAADHLIVGATVRATARTGVEMEALVAVTTAALTIYDMAKAIDPAMTLEGVRIEEKTGGIHGDYHR